MIRRWLSLCPCPSCRGHNVQQRGWRGAEVGPVQLAGAGQGGLVGRRSASAGGGADCAAEGRPQHHPHCQAHTPHRQRARELMTSEMMKRHFELTRDEDDVFLVGCCFRTHILRDNMNCTLRFGNRFLKVPLMCQPVLPWQARGTHRKQLTKPTTQFILSLSTYHFLSLTHSRTYLIGVWE